MQITQEHTHHPSWEESISELFFQRALICLWLAVIFFSLFSALDYLHSPENFSLFLLYRLAFVSFLLCCVNVLRFFGKNRYAPPIMVMGMLLGALCISLMTVELGGFYSNYYIGILLMLAGGLSGLPFSGIQAFTLGMGMYLVYTVTVLIGTGNMDRGHLVYGVNNTFFFVAMVCVAVIQCHDDMKNRIQEYTADKQLNKIQKKLARHTGNLEESIQLRLAELEVTSLKFQDLYDNVQDLIILIDPAGLITKINRQSKPYTGCMPEQLLSTNVQEILTGKDGETWLERLHSSLRSLPAVHGLQLVLTNREYGLREVEVSASRVVIDRHNFIQLVLRDISETKAIERNLLNSQRLLGTSRQAAIFGLAKLAECRDSDTGSHLNRIRTYSKILAEELALTPTFASKITKTFVEDLYYSSVLHDIGKVGIPDSILLKPGKLTEIEFEFMKKHTVFGSDVLVAAEKDLQSLSFLYTGQEIARSHHERWDSSGYPDGLGGDAIPLAARILALVDVYDALTSARVYKPPFSHEDSVMIIGEGREKQFDPRIVDAFLANEQIFKQTRTQLLLQSEKDHDQDRKLH